MSTRTRAGEAGGTGRGGRSRTVTCVIRSRTRQGNKVFEGEVTIPGLTTAKLTQVRTQEPYYTTSNAVRQAARAFAERWEANLSVEDPTAAKQAAGPAKQEAAATTNKRGRSRTTQTTTTQTTACDSAVPALA